MNELNYRIDYGTSACATYVQVHVFGEKNDFQQKYLDLWKTHP